MALTLIIGPMFAKKTTMLVEEYKKHVNKGYVCIVIKSNTDNRYSTDHVSTHDGVQIPALSVALLGVIGKYIFYIVR